MSLTAKKDLYAGFSNDAEWVSIPYNFSNDAGATGDYTVFTAKEDMVILDFYADFETQVTGAGTTTSDLGVDDGGSELWSAKAIVTAGTAQIAAGAISGMDTAAPVRVAEDEAIVFSIDTAAVTAGKINFNFYVKKQ